MNIKELAEQSGLVLDGEHWFSAIQQADVRNVDLERFAELVRADYLEEISGHTLKMVIEAVAREREACAALCEELHNCETEFRPDHCAKAIRTRWQK